MSPLNFEQEKNEMKKETFGAKKCHLPNGNTVAVWHCCGNTTTMGYTYPRGNKEEKTGIPAKIRDGSASLFSKLI